jgi:hypothetical protein
MAVKSSLNCSKHWSPTRPAQHPMLFKSSGSDRSLIKIVFPSRSIHPNSFPSVRKPWQRFRPLYSPNTVSFHSWANMQAPMDTSNGTSTLGTHVATPPGEHQNQHGRSRGEQDSADFSASISEATKGSAETDATKDVPPEYDPHDHGVRRIIRNFTPSHVPPHTVVSTKKPC